LPPPVLISVAGRQPLAYSKERNGPPPGSTVGRKTLTPAAKRLGVHDRRDRYGNQRQGV